MKSRGEFDVDLTINATIRYSMVEGKVLIEGIALNGTEWYYTQSPNWLPDQIIEENLDYLIELAQEDARDI